MRKLFTFLLTMVVAMVANAATAPTFQLGEEFKSVAALDGKTFAIVNQAEEKALFGSNNQNLGYDVYSDAFVATNSGYLWKLVSLADNADEEIRGYYYPTAKNNMVKEFYSLQGFDKIKEDSQGNTEWSLSLTNGYQKKNHVISVNEEN